MKSESEYLESLRSQLDKLQEDFGQFTSKELELRATLVFVAHQTAGLSQTVLADKVKAIKPRFDVASEIIPAIKELAGKKFVTVT